MANETRVTTGHVSKTHSSRLLVVSAKTGASLTVKMQRQTKLSLISIIQLCLATLEHGLGFIECAGCFQSDDLGIEVILEIVDDKKTISADYGISTAAILVSLYMQVMGIWISR